MEPWIQTACSLALLLLLQSPPGSGEVRGYWLNGEADAAIEITSCGESLCGRIVWLRFPGNAAGGESLDEQNPVPALRSRPLLGLTILTGHELAARPGRAHAEGRIYDPKTGRTYSSKLRVDADGSLEIRGYVGLPLLGRTTRWTRVAARDLAAWTADPTTAPPLKEGAKCDLR